MVNKHKQIYLLNRGVILRLDIESSKLSECKKNKHNFALKKAREIISHYKRDDFDKIYNYTTENISGYLDKFDLDNKSLLTVGSSGDQAINAIYRGSKDITVMDVNVFTQYYFYLKKAALLTLSYENYIEMFYYPEYGSNFLCSKQLRDKLCIVDFNSFKFWDMIYNEFSPMKIREGIFFEKKLSADSIVNVNPYLSNENTYLKTKINIEQVKPNFLNKNILNDSDSLDKKFDNIFLSNIYDYYNQSPYQVLKYKYGVEKLQQLLNDDGKMLVSYLYGVNQTLSILHFQSDHIGYEYDLSYFPGVKSFDGNDNVKDGIAVYQKRK